jgi:hypothetical protein
LGKNPCAQIRTKIDGGFENCASWNVFRINLKVLQALLIGFAWQFLGAYIKKKTPIIHFAKKLL